MGSRKRKSMQVSELHERARYLQALILNKQVDDIAMLKTRLAAAEAVCERYSRVCCSSDGGELIAAWRKAKEASEAKGGEQP